MNKLFGAKKEKPKEEPKPAGPGLTETSEKVSWSKELLIIIKH